MARVNEDGKFTGSVRRCAFGQLHVRGFGERSHHVHLREQLIPLASRRDVPRPAGDERHAVPAFPDVGLLAKQFAIAPMPGIERVAVVHPAVVAGEEHDRVLRVSVPLQRIKDEARAVIELLDVVAVEPGLALAAKPGCGVDRHMGRGESEIEEERGFLGLLGEEISRPVRHDEVDSIIRSCSLGLRTAEHLAVWPYCGE